MSETILKAGRRWTVKNTGLTDLKRRYQVVLDSVTSTNGEDALSSADLPAIGSAHPSHPNLIVDHYDVAEGAGAKKLALEVDVVYAYTSLGSTGEGTEEDPTVEFYVERWGWDAGTEEREMMTDSTGASVVNSAGDVFERVPTMTIPAPTFTKVMRFASRQTDWQDYHCKINAAAMTIGGIPFPEGTLRCAIAEEVVLSEATYRYRYTVQLKYRTNKVKIAGANAATEIGWDTAITDAGMREIGDDGLLKLIKSVNPETGREETVSSVELLDGTGHAVTRNSSTIPTPYNLRFKPYASATFPEWFYSEPPAVAPTEEQ